MIDRRVVAAGIVATPFAAALNARVRRVRWGDGVQLWSVDAELARDLEGTLRALGGVGFRRVETAGLHGRSPDAFRRAVDAAGLRVRGAHVPLPQLLDDTAATLDALLTLGAEWAVCPAPVPPRPPAGSSWIAAMREAMTRDAWLATADGLNVAGASAAARGLRLRITTIRSSSRRSTASGA